MYKSNPAKFMSNAVGLRCQTQQLYKPMFRCVKPETNRNLEA